MSDVRRVAVIGAGYFGRFHYDAWSRIEDIELVGLCVTNPQKAVPIATEFGRPDAPLPIFTDATEMADTVRPDLVDITSPPHTHLGFIETLAPKVGNLICQKPFCDGLEGAKAAIAACARTGTRLAVHENIRFQPWNTEARRLIDDGLLGDVHQIMFRLRPGDGRGPDAYLDRQPYFQKMPRFLVHETAIHWIDTFRYLVGEPNGVFARLKKVNPVIAGEDAGYIVFDFANGARGLFDGNRLSDHIAENRRRTLGEMWVEGTRATLRLDGDARIWIRRFGENTETEHPYSWNDHLFGGDCVYLCNRAIVEDWRQGYQSSIDAEAYIRNQEIEEEVYASAADGTYRPL